MGKRRRYIAGMLAVVLAAITIMTAMPPLVSYAAATARQKNQLWQGDDVTVLGHWRPTLYRWYNANDGKDLFCINQGKYMLEHTVLDERLCLLGDTVPLIDTSEQFVCLARICDWYEKGAQSDVRYAVGQFAVWAVMEGYYGDMSGADNDMNVISGHIRGNFLEQWSQLKAYLNTSGGMPSWAGPSPVAAPYQNMTLEDGAYQLKLDISSCPGLAGVNWTFPGPEWEKRVDGDQLMILYHGTGIPEGVLSAEISSIEELSWKNGASFSLYSTTDPTFQLMINGMDISGGLYLRIGGTREENDLPAVEIFQHQETFEANYQIELEKSCAETGQALQGAVFQITEQFDEGELGDLYASEMTPYFEGSRVCRTVTTDEDGHAVHRDKKFYEYSRTYCTGHPEPDYAEVPDEETDETTGEVTNDDEIAAAEEENEALRQSYEAQIEECQQTTDFHDVEGSGLDLMLADRDELYDQFIHLPYLYKIEEVTARNGYILHGLHPEDVMIEVISTTSSEAGCQIERQNMDASAAIPESEMWTDALEGRILLGLPALWSRTGREIILPNTDLKPVDELRVISSETMTLEKEVSENGEQESMAGNQNLADQGQTGQGQTDQGQTDQGQAVQGQTEQGSTDQGPTNQGQIDQGQTDQDPTNQGQIDQDPTNQGQTDQSPTNQGQTDQGQTNQSQTDQGQTNQGLTDQDSVYPDPTDQNPADQDLADQDSAYPAPTDQNPADPPAVGDKEGKHITENQESEKQNARDLESKDHSKRYLEEWNQKVEAHKTDDQAKLPAKAGEGHAADSHKLRTQNPDTQKVNDLTRNDCVFRNTAVLSTAQQSIFVHKNNMVQATEIQNDGNMDPDDVDSNDVDSNDVDSNDVDSNDVDFDDMDLDDMDPSVMNTETADSGLFRTKSPDEDDSPNDSVTNNQADTSDVSDDDLELSEDVVDDLVYNTYTVFPYEQSLHLGFAYSKEEIDQEMEEDSYYGPGIQTAREEGEGSAQSETTKSAETGSVYLMPPMEDNIPWIPRGDSEQTAHIFIIRDHRTEGEVHINKRDKDLYEQNSADSYGKSQGDATLEGAVYGLYAAEEIRHPDGKTGIVFDKGDLVSIGTTDVEGNASFLVITEESETSVKALNLEGTWVGHPILLGSYLVREIARSEGYELSVTGKDQPGSNRTALSEEELSDAGTAEVVSGLRHPVENYDGSWNDFKVKSRSTTGGYDITVSGYPEGSSFFRVEQKTELKVIKDITGWSWQPKKDSLGNVVYQTAVGGEPKTGTDGNYIRALDPETGEPLWNLDKPVSDTYVYVKRLSRYPAGTAVPEHPELWETEIDSSSAVIRNEVNHMLQQLGYGVLEGEHADAPWYYIPLSGNTNGEAITEILDWFTLHYFYDSGGVESVLKKDGQWFARIYADYRGQTAGILLDTRSGILYMKQFMNVSGSEQRCHYWVTYETGSYEIISNTASVYEKREIPENIDIVWGEPYEDKISTAYEPLYETYQAGEFLSGIDGRPLPEMETVPVYQLVSREETRENLIPLHAQKQENGTYLIHVEVTPEEETQPDGLINQYRAVAPERAITIDGVTMAYGDYLTQIAGAGISVFIKQDRNESVSYVERIVLSYPGQNAVYQDGETRQKPVIVLERIIQQAICVTKDIAQESYDDVNTYRIHRDPFTVLFGGYAGKPGAKTVKGFSFRLYRKAQLEETGKLVEREDGKGPDYIRFFENDPEAAAKLAVMWDDPDQDMDGDLTTVHAVRGSGVDDYYGTSIPLPYGVYVLVEQQPDHISGKHYEKDLPQEIAIPFAPDVENGILYENRPSGAYVYYADWSPEKLTETFGIRFCEEQNVIQAHNHDGDFLVYKYGIQPDSGLNCQNDKVESYYHYGKIERKGEKDQVYYERYYDSNGQVSEYGITLDHVATMNGVSTAIDRQYAKALVPWSILTPAASGRGHRGVLLEPGLDEDGTFNFVGYANADAENRFYHTGIRIEKLDGETKEPILHDGALFKIYAARRQVDGGGDHGVQGSGSVIYKNEVVTGGREELEALGYVEQIQWDEAQKTYTGYAKIPDYNESEQIVMKDETGNEVGIFRAYSTIREVVTENGITQKLPVGYIETYQPLGAGVYVLVEIQAPAGYQVSRPVAFEVYSDQVTYYANGLFDQPVQALNYQYEIPVTGEENKFGKREVHQIVVEDLPSRLKICKVEDGDEKIGDKNGLDGLNGVQDSGDLHTYLVKGTKEYLEARKDVTEIRWDEEERIYVGRAEKVFDQYGEILQSGSEDTFLSKDGGKPLYYLDGNYSGYGIQFSIPVSGAGLELYEGVQVSKEVDGSWSGVTVTRNGNGRVMRITAAQTGVHQDILPVGTDEGPAHEDIWDAADIANAEKQLFFYQLDITPLEYEEATGDWYVLDNKGNRICLIDPDTGMAYVYDEYHRAIAYAADAYGKKEMVQSLVTNENQDDTSNLYDKVEAVLDEQGLPVYYKNWDVTWQKEAWTTGQDGIHTVARLPFGAYILEEASVPYENGYIKSCAQGISFTRSGEEQTCYYQNDFTKIDISKIDISTGKEIQDAKLCLYEDGEEACYRSWISGYAYDDDGHARYDEAGERKKTEGPHWVDHIPPGDYVLKETRVPVEWGYVSRDPMNLTVRETGDVQTFVMVNDYTSIEIRKQDADTGQVFPDLNPAQLSLYPAVLDEEGNPLYQTGMDGDAGRPVWREEDKLVSWKTGDGKSVAATGRWVTDEYGDTEMVYTYHKIPVQASDTVKQAVYYITETGSTKFDYLPVGCYVLVETGTPTGYATAEPVLIKVKDIGHQDMVQSYVMQDVPLKVDVAKKGGFRLSKGLAEEPGSPMVSGAVLGIYEVYEDGSRSAAAIYQWTSGEDGEQKPHRITCIPTGDYVLVELITPYGFIKANDLFFTIEDTPDIQNVTMEDIIPDGRLLIMKYEENHKEIPLKGAVYQIRNQETEEILQQLVTDENGEAVSYLYPIGFINQKGVFEPYTYTVTETSAPDGYMVNPVPFEFQFTYKNALTPSVTYQYDASDRLNQIKIIKQQADSGELLSGAELALVEKWTGRVLEQWITAKQPHYINGVPKGSYIVRELKTPGPGFAIAADMEIQVTDHMEAPVTMVMNDESTDVEVKKTDGDGRLLAGARLRLTGPDGAVVKEWTTEERPVHIYGLAPGTYLLTELSAPNGYEAGSPMEIKVTGALAVCRYEYRNYRVNESGGTDPEWPGDPEKPQDPEKPKEVLGARIGTITASYEPGPAVPRRNTDSSGKQVLRARTGDETKILPYLAGFLICLIVWCGVKGYRKNGKRKR